MWKKKKFPKLLSFFYREKDAIMVRAFSFTNNPFLVVSFFWDHPKLEACPFSLLALKGVFI